MALQMKTHLETAAASGPKPSLHRAHMALASLSLLLLGACSITP